MCVFIHIHMYIYVSMLKHIFFFQFQFDTCCRISKTFYTDYLKMFTLTCVHTYIKSFISRNNFNKYFLHTYSMYVCKSEKKCLQGH